MLKNVYIWNRLKKDFVKIDPEEAAQIYKGEKIAARDSIFLCKNCNNYVTLAKRDGKYFFKHSLADEFKDCEDRSESINDINNISDELKRNLRVSSFIKFKLNFEKRLKLNFEILFPPIEEKVLKDQFDKNIIVKNFNEININIGERFVTDERVAINIGNKLNDTIYICLEKNNNVFPEVINVMSNEYIIFDFFTGKSISYGGDLYFNKSYYIYIKNNSIFTFLEEIEDFIKIYCDKDYTLFKFSLKENYIEEKKIMNIKRFLLLIGSKLTYNKLDYGVKLLWPYVTGNDNIFFINDKEKFSIFNYIVFHDKNKVYCMKNNFQQPYYLNYIEYSNHCVFFMNKYFSKKENNELLSIKINNEIVDNENIDLITLEKLPKNIKIKSECSGKIKKFSNGILKEIIQLDSSNNYSVDFEDLKKNSHIKIYIGLDLISHINICLKKQFKSLNQKNTDDQMLKKIDTVKQLKFINHKKNIFFNLNKYPKTKMKIRKLKASNKLTKEVINLLDEI